MASVNTNQSSDSASGRQLAAANRSIAMSHVLTDDQKRDARTYVCNGYSLVDAVAKAATKKPRIRAVPRNET